MDAAEDPIEPAIAAAFTEDLLRGACAPFDADPAQLELFGEHMNYVYGFRVDGERRILRITHPTHRSRGQIEAEIHWVNYLRGHGLRICGALASRDGNFVEEVGRGLGTFLVACFEFAPGRLPSRDDWGPELFRKWGAFLGRTHQLASGYEESPAGWRRHRWDEDPLIANALHNIPQDQTAVRETARELLAQFRALPEVRGSFGLCHSDLYQANFHLHDDGLHVFDTDDSHYHVG